MVEIKARRLSGQHPMNMDAKGRLSLPAGLREQLGPAADEPLFVTNGRSCLEIWTADGWEEEVRKVEALPPNNPRVRELMIYRISAARPISLDTAGRILIPPTMREDFGLTREVMVVGMTDHIEVFSNAAWTEVNGRARRNIDENMEVLAEKLN